MGEPEAVRAGGVAPPAQQSVSRLVDDRGRVRFGIFSEPVEEVDGWQSTLVDEWDRPVSRWRRYWGWNQFEFLGGLSEELIFGCALANVRYAGTVFAYVYFPKRGRMHEFSVQLPLGWGVRLDRRPEDGTSEYRGWRATVRMRAGSQPHTRLLEVDSPGFRIEAELDEQTPPLQPMRICTPAGAAGWVFARKTAGQAVRGSLRLGADLYNLERLGVAGHRDWTAGFMRRETFWNWGCFAARLPGGVAGLNISCGVNETSFTENCFWWNGRLEKLDTVAFDYDRQNLRKPWRMTSFDGRCELEFVPLAQHRERINLGVVATNFTQLIGRYNGRLCTRGGEQITLRDVWGYAEWHYAKW